MSNEENKNVLENEAENASEVSSDYKDEDTGSIETTENEDTEIIEDTELKDGEAEESVDEEKKKKDKAFSSKVPFFINLEALIIDQFICVILAMGLWKLTIIILKQLGYVFLDPNTMLFYVYIGVTILYPAILEATKLGATVGRKVSDLKLIKL